MRLFLFTLSTSLLLFSGTRLNAQSYAFKHESLPCLNKKFTIVAHVFLDSLGAPTITEMAIRQAVADINPFFAPICASFEICEFRYHENWQHDVVENTTEEIPEITTKYNVERRINMYFVTDFASPINACGLAELSGIGNPVSSFILIRKDCINARVFAHEMGHFFSLKHTFEGSGSELVDGSNCTTAGDQICDTPADPYVEGDPLGGYVDGNCRFINNKTDLSGNYYNPDLGNIMSYYDCDTCGFTWGQLSAMAKAYLATAIKFW
ncbi:MAG: M12 family metallo-peptidase [Saprospiraceae bacterium]